MQDNIPDALIAAFERHYDFPWNEPTLRNERLAWRAAWAEATKPCLHQIQEPAPAEQAAWHAGLDEGRAQAAPAAVAVPDERAAATPTDEQLQELWKSIPAQGDPTGMKFAIAFARAALAATPAAAATVVLPEPAIAEVMKLVELHRQEIIKVMDDEGSLVDVQSAQDAIETKLRALLATATGLPTQAVEMPDFDLRTSKGGRGFVAWYFANVLQRYDYENYITNKLAADFACDLAKALSSTLAEPQAQADARDADGEAFRTAARLGLTLRFYGNCAQSGTPGTPSVYEVTTGPDSAEAMRASIDRAAIAAAKGE